MNFYFSLLLFPPFLLSRRNTISESTTQIKSEGERAKARKAYYASLWKDIAYPAVDTGNKALRTKGKGPPFAKLSLKKFWIFFDF